MSTFNAPTTTHHLERRRLSPALRLQALAGRGRLDRLLADGRSPASDPLLAVRAGQLTHPARRRRLAASLRDAVCSLEDSALAQYLRPEVPVAAASVRACAHEIDELARALTGPSPRPRGVAIVRVLLTDSAGPLYNRGQAGGLRATVLAALDAI